MLNIALRKAVAIASLTIPMVGALPETTMAARQDFRVHNQTGRTMVGLWVSDSDNGYWGDNILNRMLPSGYYTTVFFPNGSSSCWFDIAAEFSDGSTAKDYGINLCRVANYTFYP
jgi:hypothetical protein